MCIADLFKCSRYDLIIETIFERLHFHVRDAGLWILQEHPSAIIKDVVSGKRNLRLNH